VLIWEKTGGPSSEVKGLLSRNPQFKIRQHKFVDGPVEGGLSTGRTENKKGKASKFESGKTAGPPGKLQKKNQKERGVESGRLVLQLNVYEKQ